jgi:predicted PurR-regulated permease PerM
VNQGVIANIYGMLAVGVAEGILIALGFWLTGLPSPLVWGAVATIFSVMPYVGISVVWISGCVVLVLRGNWASAIWLCGASLWFRPRMESSAAE